MALVRIPTPLRPHAGGQDRVEAVGATVGEVLANLGTALPGLRERLFDGEELRRFVTPDSIAMEAVNVSLNSLGENQLSRLL